MWWWWWYVVVIIWGVLTDFISVCWWLLMHPHASPHHLSWHIMVIMVMLPVTPGIWEFTLDILINSFGCVCMCYALDCGSAAWLDLSAYGVYHHIVHLVVCLCAFLCATWGWPCIHCSSLNLSWHLHLHLSHLCVLNLIVSIIWWPGVLDECVWWVCYTCPSVLIDCCCCLGVVSVVQVICMGCKPCMVVVARLAVLCALCIPLWGAAVKLNKLKCQC